MVFVSSDCNCNKNGSSTMECNQKSGKCKCNKGYYGDKCNDCKFIIIYRLVEVRPSAQILLQCHLSTFKHCQKSKVSNSNIWLRVARINFLCHKKQNCGFYYLGVIHKPCRQRRGRGFLKKPCLSTRGEGESKMVKNPSTWFMDAALGEIFCQISRKCLRKIGKILCRVHQSLKTLHIQ